MSTTLEWVGGKHHVFNAASWSPAGKPARGDTLVIGPGTTSDPNIAVVHGHPLNDVTVLLDDGPGAVGSPDVPALSLVNTSIGARTLIENQIESSPGLGAADTEDVRIHGTVRNHGTIGENPGALIGNTFNIELGHAATLVNAGTGTISGTTLSDLTIDGGKDARLVNNGTITGQGTTLDIGVDVTGKGSFVVSGGGNPGSHTAVPSTLAFQAAVGAGLTIDVNDTTLVLDQPMRFLATIDDGSVTPPSAFATNSDILLKGESATGFCFQNDTLTVRNGQQTLAQLHFTSGLTAGDFSLADTSEGAQITVAAPAQMSLVESSTVMPVLAHG
jgi:hypothetical protein